MITSYCVSSSSIDNIMMYIYIYMSLNIFTCFVLLFSVSRVCHFLSISVWVCFQVPVLPLPSPAVPLRAVLYTKALAAKRTHFSSDPCKYSYHVVGLTGRLKSSATRYTWENAHFVSKKAGSTPAGSTLVSILEHLFFHLCLKRIPTAIFHAHQQEPGHNCM